MANLNENFKIKNGLTVATTISAGGNIATDGAILSGDINIDQLFGTGGGSGTITEVVAGTGLTGGGTTGCVILNLSAGDGVEATANCVSVDSTVVRTTGAQSIAGIKSFSDTVCANSDTFVGNMLTVNGDSQLDGALTVDDFVCFKDSLTLDGNSTTSGTAIATTLSATKICSNDAYFNSAIGCLALDSTTTGCKNVAVGLCSSQNQTTGSHNVALGDCSSIGNTTGSHNVTIGSQAGFYALSGDHNMAMGQFALYDNWGGDYNTAIGSASMQCNTTGSNNAALGYRAMMNNTTGNDNFAVGECALQSNVNGIGNTALGHNAFGSSVTGNYSVAIGDNAGTYFANGCNTLSAASDSIYIGRNTKGKDNNDNNSIVIGYNACSCGQNTIKIGNNSITAACIQVAWTAVSDERDKTDITDLNHGLEFIGDLKPKAFKYRRTRTSSSNDGICRYGFLAQDIQGTEDGDKVIVSESNPEQLGLNSDYLVPILVKAVQELEARVVELEG